MAPFKHDGVRERAALGAVLGARSCIWPQIVFIPNFSKGGVNHANRIVIVVGGDDRFAIG